MSYDTAKLTNLGQMKSALQKVYQEVTAAKSTRRTATISVSNWAAYDTIWRYPNIQATSNYHFYDVHLASDSSASISVMCANADIRAKIESSQINLYCYGTKPNANFDVEIIITPTTTDDVGITYDIGDDFLVYPAITDALDARITTLEDTTVPAVQAEVDALETVVANQILTAQNISLAASRWNLSGVTAYPYKAEINVTGVTSEYFPMVQFRDEDSLLYEFSPSVAPTTGKLVIYCKTLPTTTIVIPTIFCVKGTTVTAS